MRNNPIYFCLALFLLLSQIGFGQEGYKRKIEALKAKKERIVEQEREALKEEVQEINHRLERGEISQGEAETLKKEAAKIRALNIEGRLAIVEQEISLLERNRGEVLVLGEEEDDRGQERDIGIFIDGKRAFGFKTREQGEKIRFDRRTYSDPVLAIGLNNALVDGSSLEDGPYRIGGSRFLELGWQWRTRVFQNSNWLRVNYGFSFQFNGLKPEGNRIFVEDGGQTVLEEYEYELDKAKLRMDHLVVPVHFEIGPSKYREREDSFRYSIKKKFRLGLGGYAGINLGTRQKLKYNREGKNVKDKLKRDYNTSDLIYGLSGYMGFDGVSLYLKYDLNPIFKDAAIEQHNISLGLRFDI